MTDEKKVVYFPVYITWESFSPDRREWKPSTPILKVSLKVKVDMPLSAEYIANSDKIITAQIAASDEPVAILTPKGMRYVIDQIESVMTNTQKANETKAINETEWEDDENKTADNDKPTTVEEEVTWTDDTTKNDNLLDENEIEWE